MMMDNKSLQEEDWPSLSGQPAAIIVQSKPKIPLESEEWEQISNDEASEKEVKFVQVERQTKVSFINHKTLQRCMSTPEFSQVLDDDSYVTDGTSSVDAFSLDDTVLLAKKPVSSSIIKKVPSFKDIILLNAKEKEREEEENRIAMEQEQKQIREEALQRRKQFKPKIVIKPILRSAKSTGDLRSMVIHEHEEEEDICGGGGGGSGCGDPVIHEEVLGETDAMEFYNRKSKGSQSRSNGQKIRPDEAKRKEIIMYKKEAQRKAQNSN